MARALGVLGNYGYTNKHSEYVILIAFPLQQWLVARTRIYVNVIRTLPSSLYLLWTIRTALYVYDDVTDKVIPMHSVRAYGEVV
jgi:hypothetical protein